MPTRNFMLPEFGIVNLTNCFKLISEAKNHFLQTPTHDQSSGGSRARRSQRINIFQRQRRALHHAPACRNFVAAFESLALTRRTDRVPVMVGCYTPKARIGPTRLRWLYESWGPASPW